MRTTRRSPSKLALLGEAPCAPTWLEDSLAAAWAAGRRIAAMPFDVMRANHAIAAKAGLVQNSMLASRDFEHVVSALERATLGPLARRV